jgi:N-acetylglucosaminyl-diphospho-decaprenol L-rhamnosyltransferase
LDELLAAAKRWPDGGAFGPLIRRVDGAIYPSARALPSLRAGVGHAVLGWWWPGNPWTRAFRMERVVPVERVTGWLSGSCLLLRREAFEAVGGFDRSYLIFFEDLDLGARLAGAGWRSVYVPSACVTHVGGHATGRDGRRMAWEHHRSAIRYVSRRYAGWRWAPLRVLLRAGLWVRAGLAGRVRRVALGAAPQRYEQDLTADPTTPASR